MKVKQVRAVVSRTVNLGNYESLRVEAEMTVDLELPETYEDTFEVVFERVFDEVYKQIEEGVKPCPTRRKH